MPRVRKAGAGADAAELAVDLGGRCLDLAPGGAHVAGDVRVVDRAARAVQGAEAEAQRSVETSLRLQPDLRALIQEHLAKVRQYLGQS